MRMNSPDESNDYKFLADGGEMGDIIRSIDWDKTSLGNIKNWPASLRTTLGIILHSAFPMCFFWGDELVCFYNDAFRPSLGKDGKHPAIGKKGKDVWPETWDFIGPLINQVITTAKPVSFTDQLVPFYRNGKLEDIYWTFCYSAAYDDDGKVNGVVVTCSETTESVVTKKDLQESERKLRTMIGQAPVSIGIFRGKEYVTEMANALAFELLGRKEEDVINKPILDAMPELKTQGIKELLDEVYDTGKSFSASELPVQITRKGKLETVYLNFSFEPLFNSNEQIDGIIGAGIEVTDQVITRQKGKENENRFRAIADNIPNLAWMANADGWIYWYNKKWYDYTGTTPEQMQGWGWQSVHDPEVLPEVLAKWQLSIEKGKAFEMVFPIKDTDNKFRQFLTRVLPVYDDLGKISNWFGSNTDITEQVETQRKLEESEKKFRLLADSMPQHIWTADPQGNLNYFNQSVFDYSGLSPEQIAKEGWIQIVHPDDREENIKIWTDAITTGKDFLFEHRFRRYDGEYRWQLSRAIPHRDENGNVQMWVGTSTDIQEQKNFRNELEKQVNERTAELVQLNESLKKSELRYHLMVEEVQDYAILYLNREGIVENWNTGAEKIKGYKAEEIIGKSFSNFYTEDDKANQLHLKLLGMAAQNGRALQEGWRVRKNGTLFWASVVITAVHDEKKEVIGFSKVTHDLTEKKEANDALNNKRLELEQKNTELQKMNKELQSFAYISSHDLQEPLRKIQTFSSRIAEIEKQNLSDYGMDLFKRMQTSAERMQSLIDDLLAYSRTQNFERDFQKVNLNDVIENVKQDLEEEIQEKNATVSATNITCEVNIIPFQFHQLFYNLISNSLKFSDPKKPLNITINYEYVKGSKLENEIMEEDKNYCHVTVTDNGIGFEQHYSEKIFELFQRLHGKKDYEGTGIGLAIIKRIVENHNGFITAKGELGIGATFDIYLPDDGESSQ